MTVKQEQLIESLANELSITYEEVQEVVESLFPIVGDWMDLSVEDGNLLIDELIRLNMKRRGYWE